MPRRFGSILMLRSSGWGVKVEPKIEKNIPMPPKGRVGGRNTKYLYLEKIIRAWQVGDSVAFEFSKKTTGKDRRPSYSVETNAFTKKAQRAGQKVSSRILVDEGIIRVWRIE